jgi:flagella basal body P-ring formation protein FlgA
MRCCWPVLCLLILATQGLAADWQDPASIREAAEDFVRLGLSGRDGVKISASGLDERVRLPRCGVALEAAAPRGLAGGQGLVTVSCAAPAAWQLFVPVRASYLVDVVVARQALRRGQRLTAAELAIVRRDSTGLPASYLGSVEDALGMTLKRGLPAGALVSPALLDVPQAVARGELVTLIAASAGVLVKAEGRALENAALDERLRVRTASGRIVEGTAGPGNQVYVGSALPPGPDSAKVSAPAGDIHGYDVGSGRGEAQQ